MANIHDEVKTNKLTPNEYTTTQLTVKIKK